MTSLSDKFPSRLFEIWTYSPDVFSLSLYVFLYMYYRNTTPLLLYVYKYCVPLMRIDDFSTGTDAIVEPNRDSRASWNCASVWYTQSGAHSLYNSVISMLIPPAGLRYSPWWMHSHRRIAFFIEIQLKLNSFTALMDLRRDDVMASSSLRYPPPSSPPLSRSYVSHYSDSKALTASVRHIVLWLLFDESRERNFIALSIISEN